MQLSHSAPRGGCKPCGGERTPPDACRSRRLVEGVLAHDAAVLLFAVGLIVRGMGAGAGHENGAFGGPWP